MKKYHEKLSKNCTKIDKIENPGTRVLRLKKPNPSHPKKPGFKPDPGKLGSFTISTKLVLE